MQDKEIEKIQDKKKHYDVLLLVMGAVFILSGIVYLFLDRFVSKTATFIYLICWLVYSVAFIVVWLVLGFSIKKKEKKIRVNNYSFDRNEKIEQTITSFESINNDEKVIFNRKKLRFAGAEISYEDLNFDYLTYEDNILLHIYSRENDENPLLIFVVTKDFYFCMKFFKLHMDKLDKEIDLFNLNFKK
ncbi:MAG: hypothetical protein IKC11_02470 [Clostridia bacterium]|nr:hypothetical protein [Clostridia bacterium]